MLEQNANGLELHWVEVRDGHGAHMEAHWTLPDVAPATVESHTPHAA